MSGVVRAGASRAMWLACWASWLVLFLQQFADALTLGLPAVIWVGKLLPLLLFLPGMLRDRLRSFIWLCFVTLLYFIALVERMFALPGSVSALIGLVAVVILFTACMLYVRLRAREIRAASPMSQGD